MRRIAALAALALCSLPGTTAFAQAPAPQVAFAGLTSPDVSAAELAEAEAAIEQMLGRQTRVRGKSATLGAIGESEGIANALAQARFAADAGAAALDAFELPRALEELGRALALYETAIADRLAPQEVVRVLERRAQALYALRRTAEMRQDFARILALAPGRSLDERVFAPDAIALFQAEAVLARSAAPVPPKADALADVARRAGARFALSGDARVADGGSIELFLTMVSASGAAATQRVRVPRDSPATGLERGLAPMVDALGVPKREAIAVATPAPKRATSKTRERDGRPVYAQWWFWGGVVAVGAAAAYAGSEALDRPSGGSGGGGTTTDPGVTIEFEERE